MGIDLMPADEQEQRAIVFLTRRAREQLHGARNWDETGIAAAVAKVAHLHLVDIANAAMRAADDRNLETPGAIGNPQAPCWRERATDRPTPRTPHDPVAACDVCSRPAHQHNDLSGHEFESRHDADRRRAQQPPRNTPTMQEDR